MPHMNIGAATLGILIVAAVGITLYAIVRAFASSHIGWALAILLLPGPSVIIVARHPLPALAPPTGRVAKARTAGTPGVTRRYKRRSGCTAFERAPRTVTGQRVTRSNYVTRGLE